MTANRHVAHIFVDDINDPTMAAAGAARRCHRRRAAGTSRADCIIFDTYSYRMGGHRA